MGGDEYPVALLRTVPRLSILAGTSPRSLKPQSRRVFISTVGAAALGIAGCSGQAARPRRKIDSIGLQLYTVRELMKTDVPGTLARVAEIGYRKVEFAGYFGKSPAEIRDLLARNGLTSPSAHVSLDQLRKDWRRALDDARSIGHQWVIIAWLPEEERRTVDSWKRLIAEFNDAARAAREAGLRFAYHNHDFELRPIPGAGRTGSTIPLELLFAETDPTLVEFQLDLYWVVKGGGDPSSYFARFGKRIPLVHVKDSAGPPAHVITEVGGGTIDFPRIFADAGASIEHFYVEHDDPADALASIRSSFGYLKALEY